ncbi:hypothetical protein Godav_000953 [Gossypium davidsonii]|uniref:RNase H type-1 domain-containing protein n=1 Tax=Gossypium davidsonii TaxID=34287 RepID=A0A7J8T1A8_GOSDV|nr:hypothetical protein [Gossypium davidsonii]
MHIPTVFAMEALACLQAIRSGLDLGLQEVIFEGDALTVVKKILNNSRNRSTISAYIEDAKSYQWIKKGEEYLSYWWSVEIWWLRVVGFSKKMEDREKLGANKNSGIIVGRIDLLESGNIVVNDIFTVIEGVINRRCGFVLVDD